MPFDPAFPATDALLVSAEFRAQFHALNDKIDAQQARLAALEAALGDTAHNPNQRPLNLALSDPPSRNEVIQLLDAYNALLNQITRV